MPRAWFPCLGLICAVVLAQPVRPAEIWVHVYEQEPRALGQLFILGEIDSGDIEQLGSTSAYANAEDIVLTHAKLYSSGGDVATALVIGHELRKLRITTIAPHHPQYIGRDFRGERRCVSDDRLESIDKSEAPVGADDPKLRLRRGVRRDLVQRRRAGRQRRVASRGAGFAPHASIVTLLSRRNGHAGLAPRRIATATPATTSWRPKRRPGL